MGSPRWVPLGHTLCQLLTQEADPPGRETEWPLGQSVREQVQWTRAVGAPFWDCSGLGEVPELGEVCTWKSLVPRRELGEHLGRSPEGEDMGLARHGGRGMGTWHTDCLLTWADCPRSHWPPCFSAANFLTDQDPQPPKAILLCYLPLSLLVWALGARVASVAPTLFHWTVQSGTVATTAYLMETSSCVGFSQENRIHSGCFQYEGCSCRGRVLTEPCGAGRWSVQTAAEVQDQAARGSQGSVEEFQAMGKGRRGKVGPRAWAWLAGLGFVWRAAWTGRGTR